VLDKNHAEPWNKNDAAAIAALFTEDAAYLTDRGPVNGRQAIENILRTCSRKCILATISSRSISFSPHIIGTVSDEEWATGEWSLTIQGQNGGPMQLKGYWVAIKVREGYDWRIRMLAFNITPPPAGTPSPTTTPSSQ
jgi:uncharacterized protein (TIGR02246 family)